MSRMLEPDPPPDDGIRRAAADCGTSPTDGGSPHARARLDVERLIGRVVDGEASPEEWQRFVRRATDDPALWQRLAEEQRLDVVLRRGVADAIAAAAEVDLAPGGAPSSAPAADADADADATPPRIAPHDLDPSRDVEPPTLSPQPHPLVRWRRRLRRHSGWAAAVVIGTLWAVMSHSGPESMTEGKGISLDRPGGTSSPGGVDIGDAVPSPPVVRADLDLAGPDIPLAVFVHPRYDEEGNLVARVVVLRRTVQGTDMSRIIDLPIDEQRVGGEMGEVIAPEADEETEPDPGARRNEPLRHRPLIPGLSHAGLR